MSDGTGIKGKLVLGSVEMDAEAKLPEGWADSEWAAMAEDSPVVFQEVPTITFEVRWDEMVLPCSGCGTDTTVDDATIISVKDSTAVDGWRPAGVVCPTCAAEIVAADNRWPFSRGTDAAGRAN